MADYIYVILDDLTSAIKVGYSNNPITRLSNLQTAHSATILKLLTIFEGGKEHEAYLHEQLNNHRLNGEWFAYNLETKAILFYYFKNYLNGVDKFLGVEQPEEIPIVDQILEKWRLNKNNNEN